MSFLKNLVHTASLKLSQEQLSAAMHHKGPALTLAIPGSGKTTLLLCRTLNLIEEHGVHPNQILSVTFSKASAQDMQARYHQLFYRSYPYEVTFSTIHRFAYGIVRAYAKHMNRNYQLLEDSKGKHSKHRILRELHLEINQEQLTDDKYEELVNHIGYIKNMMIQPHQYKDHDLKFQNLEKLLKGYDQYKAKHHLIDFDDMLCLALEVLQNHPNTLEWYQKRYPYIQVDETQDTSRVQHEIIQLLGAKSKNIFMVADDDQSIYGFRGADPGFLLDFKKAYPTGTLYWLSTNYRCASPILEACSDVIKRNTKRYEKKMASANPHKAPVRVHNFETPVERDQWLFESIGSQEGVSGILYRNNLSAIPLIDQLDRLGLEFNIRDRKMHFFNHWLLRDIKAFLNLSLLRQDLQSFEQVAFRINGYISRKALDYVKGNHRGRNVFDVLVEFPGAGPRQKSLWTNYNGLFERMGSVPPMVAMTMIEQELGYMDYLEENGKRMGQSFDTSRYMLQVLKQLASSCSTHLEFMERLEYLNEKMRQSGPSSSAIRLSTIHGSKGLEYDQVYLLDVEEGILPSTRRQEDIQKDGYNKELEEERRLFYVAMSRAKTNLHILNVKFRGGRFIKKSVFVTDLLADQGDKLDTVQHEADHKGGELVHDFVVGKRIVHLRFGEGTILDVSEDIIRIDFGDTTKALSLPLCIEKGFLVHPD